MEKKELRKRIEGLVGEFIYREDGDVIIDIKEALLDFVSQELDKAREGGFFDETELLYLMMLLQNDNAKGRDTERPNKTAKEKISKLLKQ